MAKTVRVPNVCFWQIDGWQTKIYLLHSYEPSGQRRNLNFVSHYKYSLVISPVRGMMLWENTCLHQFTVLFNPLYIPGKKVLNFIPQAPPSNFFTLKSLKVFCGGFFNFYVLKKAIYFNNHVLNFFIKPSINLRKYFKRGFF